VHDRRTGFIVFLLRNPHLLEGGKRRQDGSTDPDGVFSLGRRDDLDLHGRRRQGGDLLLHSVGDAGIHGRTTREDRVSVKIFTDVDITLHDAVVGRLVDTAGFHSEEGWLEKRFWASESFISDGDDLSVGKLVRFLQGRGGGGGGHLLFEVESDVAKLLLDVTDDFTLGRGGEGVASLREDLHEVIGEITMDGKTARGASSPAKPALHMPDPLSTTKAATSSSHMFGF